MEFENYPDGTPTFFAYTYVSDDAVQQCFDAFKVLTPHQGTVNKQVMREYKDSLDVSIAPNHNLIIQAEIEEAAKKYWEYFNLQRYYPNGFEIREFLNIQRYAHSEAGFHEWHCERNTHQFTARRELVFMVYLNDVKEGGETGWLYQNKKLTPEKGLLVFWPPQWMFTHKGFPSQDTKTIITGWMDAAPF